MFTIKLDRLALFVSALNEVVLEYPVVHMMSVRNPECGTPGCHAGLARLALMRLCVLCTSWRGYEEAADALARYLSGTAHETYEDLERWARCNPDIWGGDSCFMFSRGSAFNQASDRFPSSVIAEHWAGVLERARRAESKIMSDNRGEQA